MLWLAVLNLGSLRSPFVPDAYAWVGTIWLATLLFANLKRPTVSALGAMAVLVFALSQVFDGILLPGQATPAWMLTVTLAIQVVALDGERLGASGNRCGACDARRSS